MISDKALSIMLFLQRIVFVSATSFLAAGEALHINAFTQNAIDIGLPFARPVCAAIVALTFICGVCVLAGLAFRAACCGFVIVSLFSGFFFFAGGINKVNLVGVLFALTILTEFIATGPGKISLSYLLERQRIKNNKRIAFR
jgi:uncharacterized membrane protein YphA (DoxX/SURF4 family)